MEYLPVIVCVSVILAMHRFLWSCFFLFNVLLLSIQSNNLLLTPLVNLITINETQ